MKVSLPSASVSWLMKIVMVAEVLPNPKVSVPLRVSKSP